MGKQSKPPLRFATWKAHAYERTFRISHSTQDKTLSTFEGAPVAEGLDTEMRQPEGNFQAAMNPYVCRGSLIRSVRWKLQLVGSVGADVGLDLSLSGQKDSSAPKPREKEGKRHGSRVLGVTSGLVEGICFSPTCHSIVHDNNSS